MDEYRGFQEIMCDDARLSDFMEILAITFSIVCKNEYVLIYDIEGRVKDFINGMVLHIFPLLYKTIKNSYTGNIKPRNPQQRLAMDLLYNDDITVKDSIWLFWIG